MPEPLSFFIPVKGRFVSGDHDKIRTTDHHGKQEPDRAKHKYTFGVAFPKAELGPWLAEQLWPYLSTQWAANQDAMNRLNAWWKQPGLASKLGGVSMKITDGDRTDAKGRTNENTKGCFVFWLETFGSGYAGEHPHPAEPAKVFAGPNPNALVQIDLSQMKRGDYVTFCGNLCAERQKRRSVWCLYELLDDLEARRRSCDCRWCGSCNCVRWFGADGLVRSVRWCRRCIWCRTRSGDGCAGKPYCPGPRSDGSCPNAGSGWHLSSIYCWWDCIPY